MNNSVSVAYERTRGIPVSRSSSQAVSMSLEFPKGGGRERWGVELRDFIVAYVI